jgi:Rad3-related DNA helicase
MGYKFQNNSIPKMARKLLELQERHSDTKGLVHSTYGVAEKLKKQLEGHTGFIWHDKNNKEARLKEFKEAPPGAVFVASGMYSGLDLAGPEYGWQAITKVPWPSKADKLIAHWYDTDFDWISWLVIRDVLQASGRVNRYAGDYAVTYLLDTAFGDPMRNRKGILTQFKGKFPKDFYRRLV